jgi:dihydrofolate reductase
MVSNGKRKLKLQVQMSVDGYVGRLSGELDWMTRDWDDKIKNFVNDLTDSVDTILLGRKMTDGFVTYWTDVVSRPDDLQYEFARKMVDKPKIVFTKTLNKSVWENTSLAKGNLAEEINNLKKQPGRDIIVYGGASFVSSLINNNLIDEYYLFINPAVIGSGITIFQTLDNNFKLDLVKSIGFECGIVLNHYKPKLNQTFDTHLQENSAKK